MADDKNPGRARIAVRQPIKVRATRPGYYGKYREEGDVFVVRGKDDLGSWMAPIETSVPEGPAGAAGESIA